jgi:hypothetical protein
MDQRMIVADLALKGTSARAIQEDLTTTLERGEVAYSSVTRYLRKAQLLLSSQDAPSADVHSGIHDANESLLSALDEDQFALSSWDSSGAAP